MRLHVYCCSSPSSLSTATIVWPGRLAAASLWSSSSALRRALLQSTTMSTTYSQSDPHPSNPCENVSPQGDIESATDGFECRPRRQNRIKGFTWSGHCVYNRFTFITKSGFPFPPSSRDTIPENSPTHPQGFLGDIYRDGPGRDYYC